MGVTKILSIKHQLSARLNYVTNSEKTHLATDITYITNPEKTEQSFFVSAINLSLIHISEPTRSHQSRPTTLAWSFASDFWTTALKL